MNESSPKRLSAAALMFIMCLLPILLFYLLLMFGVVINPFVVLLIVTLCCLAMSHMMMGAGEQTACHGHKAEPDPEEQIEVPADLRLDDLITIRSEERIGGVLALHGELLGDADEVTARLRERLSGTGLTPLLQDDEYGRTRVLLLPVDLEQAGSNTRSPWINVGLFVATLLTTTWAGALHQGVNLLAEPGKFTVGLPYSLGLMLILGAHELGHYFAARAHGMKVTLPYFIPIPFALGTFGAFIQLKSPSASRRALFDVGVAGPLAGLVFAIPALLIGLQMSGVVEGADETGPMLSHHGASVGSSVLLTLMAKLALGDAISHGHVLALHPLAFAGWLGLLVTALNLLPIGQLDGGHIADAMFGQRRSASISTAALLTLFFLGLFVWSGLLMWAFIAFFIAGRKGLPPLNDVTRLDFGRSTIGTFSFLLLLAILTPVPHAFWESLGIHCPYL